MAKTRPFQGWISEFNSPQRHYYKISILIGIDNEVWTNIEGKMEICISLKQIGDAFTIKTLKTNLESNKASKVTKMCKNNISKEEAYKAIEEFTKWY